jgi:uncharacterized protein YbjT (DUF2867 family)
VLLLSPAAAVNAGAGHNPIARQHRAVEQPGIGWTFIRPGMSAASTRWRRTESIRTADTVRIPYPDAQAAPVRGKDMAALAVTALTGPGHGHQADAIYGPESLTLQRQAEQIGDAAGREIGREVISREQAQAEPGKTMPPIGAEAILRAREAGNGIPARTSVIVEKITGRSAHTFAQWAADHADDFR